MVYDKYELAYLTFNKIISANAHGATAFLMFDDQVIVGGSAFATNSYSNLNDPLMLHTDLNFQPVTAYRFRKWDKSSSLDLLTHDKTHSKVYGLLLPMNYGYDLAWSTSRIYIIRYDYVNSTTRCTYPVIAHELYIYISKHEVPLAFSIDATNGFLYWFVWS